MIEIYFSWVFVAIITLRFRYKKIKYNKLKIFTLKNPIICRSFLKYNFLYPFYVTIVDTHTQQIFQNFRQDIYLIQSYYEKENQRFITILTFDLFIIYINNMKREAYFAWSTRDLNKNTTIHQNDWMWISSSSCKEEDSPCHLSERYTIYFYLFSSRISFRCYFFFMKNVSQIISIENESVPYWILNDDHETIFMSIAPIIWTSCHIDMKLFLSSSLSVINMLFEHNMCK